MRNQGTILGIAISLLVVSVVFIYVSQVYVPSLQTKIENENRIRYTEYKVLVVNEEGGFEAGTLITQDLFDDGKISIQVIPQNFLPRANANGMDYYVFNIPGSSSDDALKAQVLNKTITTKVVKGSMLTYSCLQDEETVKLDHSKRDMQIEVENSAGELLKQGKYIDIIIKYLNGEYDIVVAKTMVNKVILPTTSEDTTTTSSDDGEKITIQVSLNEREYRDLELAKRFGDLSVRVYSDSKQYAALQTFDYNKMISLVNEVMQRESQGNAGRTAGEHDSYYTEVSLFIDGSKDTIVLDSENYIKLQEYSDIYCNRIEPIIKDKKIQETLGMEEFVRYSAIKKILKETNVDIQNVSYEEILNYPFSAEVQRQNVINTMNKFTKDELKDMTVEYVKKELLNMNLNDLKSFAAQKGISEMSSALAKATNKEDDKQKAIDAVPNTNTLVKAYFETDTQTYDNYIENLVNQYDGSRITLSQIAYITKYEKVDIVVSLIAGNKSILNSNNLDRKQIYEKYSADYVSALDTRRVVADNLVNHMLEFYQKNGSKIDSVAYLVENDLYYQYLIKDSRTTNANINTNVNTYTE